MTRRLTDTALDRHARKVSREFWPVFWRDLAFCTAFTVALAIAAVFGVLLEFAAQQ
jgi:hypothetical protein